MYLELECRTANGGYKMDIFHGDKRMDGKPAILTIYSGGDHPISLNDTVVSNGRYGPPAGTKGRVVLIREPHIQSWSNNCIGVLFGNEFEWMKHKDLVFENGYVVGRSEVAANV